MAGGHRRNPFAFPRTWAGASSQIHPHIIAAIFLGGAITALPVYLACAYSGKAWTRHVIAVAQMLMSSLFVHLSGGRIETHFHVFGSLAFIAFYRDWRVLLTATVVAGLDHALRGMFWPQTVYGVLSTSNWRTLEHVGWVAFEDIVLWISMQQSVREMTHVAGRQAALEDANDDQKRAEDDLRCAQAELEQRVVDRTAELAETNRALRAENTERKRAEEVLRESEARFRSMFEQSGVGMVITDADGRLLQANPAFCRFLDYSSDQLVGRNTSDLTDPRDAEETRLQSEELRSGAREVIELEKRYIKKDGSTVWGRVSAHFLHDSDGHRRSVAIIQDITERKAGEKARKKAEEKYRSIFENAVEGIYQTTPEGEFLAINPAAARTLGFASPDQIMGEPSATRSYGYVDPKRLGDFMRLVEEHDIVNGFESEVYRPDGSRVWVSENVRVVRGSSGEILYFEGTLEDITERKRAEAERQVISDIVQGVTTTTNLDELLDLAHRSIGKLLYAENCFIALHDPATDLVHFEFWVDKLDPVPPPQPVGGHTRTSYVLRTGQPLLLTEELKTRLFEQGEVKRVGPILLPGWACRCGLRRGPSASWPCSTTRRKALTASATWSSSPPWEIRSPWPSSASGPRKNSNAVKHGWRKRSKWRVWAVGNGM